jgi:hypothetical protein
MNWDKLDIHLENLVPGLATIWVISQWYSPKISAGLEVIVGVALVAVAYLAGVIVNVLSRLTVDRPSEWWTRAPIFRRLARQKLTGVEQASREEINQAFNHYCTCAIKEAKATAREVEKRRQTGRLLRSSLIPGVLFVWHLWWGTLQTICMIAIMIPITIAAWFLLLLLYGFAEVSILDEAYHSVPPAERSIQGVQQYYAERTQVSAHVRHTKDSVRNGEA